MRRLLLLGAGGMFGRDAAPAFEAAGFPVAGGDLPAVDIASPESLARFLDAHPADVVVNAAAYTDVDGAESRVDEASRANAAGAGAVARACSERGLFLVHLSTDHVFPGDRPHGYSPGDPPGPAVNAYGRTKLEGERAVAAAMPPGRFLVCRTQWLYGRTGRSFPDAILRLSAARGELRVVDDQWGAPTYTDDLAGQIVALLRAGAAGIAHAVNGGGPVTRFRFAEALVKAAGLACRVVPCATAEFPRPAARPRHGWLRQGLPTLPVRSWEVAMCDYLRATGRAAA